MTSQLAFTVIKADKRQCIVLICPNLLRVSWLAPRIPKDWKDKVLMSCLALTRPHAKGLAAFLCMVGAIGLGLTLSQSVAWAKRPSLQMPCYEKLLDGAGPETNDIHANPVKVEQKLSPVTLNEDTTSLKTSSDGNGGHYLKSTVTATGFAPKGPIDPASKSLFGAKDISQSNKLGQNDMLKQAKNVSAMPLPLMESEEEAQKKIDTILDAEKVQLADLWESTLTRSPDIQFVVQKLMPTSNPGRASTVMMRMLSSAIFGAMGAVTMLSPSPAAYAGSNMGASMIMNVLQLQENKQAQKARLSQTESIMLYNMVRSTADKLVEFYRNYKKSMVGLAKSLSDLQDLQNMVAEARAGQDAAKQLEMEYTIRKAQRDCDTMSEDAKRFRQSLVDLAGAEALAKLDKQLEDEQGHIEQAITGSPTNQKTAAGPGAQS